MIFKTFFINEYKIPRKFIATYYYSGIVHIDIFLFGIFKIKYAKIDFNYEGFNGSVDIYDSWFANFFEWHDSSNLSFEIYEELVSDLKNIKACCENYINTIDNKFLKNQDE